MTPPQNTIGLFKLTLGFWPTADKNILEARLTDEIIENTISTRNTELCKDITLLHHFRVPFQVCIDNNLRAFIRVNVTRVQFYDILTETRL